MQTYSLFYYRAEGDSGAIAQLAERLLAKKASCNWLAYGEGCGGPVGEPYCANFATYEAFVPGVSSSFGWESAAPEDEDEVKSLLAELRSDFPNVEYRVTARFGYDNWDVYDFDESYDGASLSETDNASERLDGFDKIADADPDLLSDLAVFLGYEDEDDLIEQVGDPDYLADEIEDLGDEEEGPALLKRYKKAFWGE